jgi:hypothetical protein
MIMGFFGFPARARTWEFSTNALRKELAALVIGWQQRLAIMGDPKLAACEAHECARLLSIARVAGIAVVQ